jgi:hypothetical protein
LRPDAGGCRQRRFEARLMALQAALRHLDIELLFATRYVMIKRCLTDADRLGDVPQRYRIVAAFAE